MRILKVLIGRFCVVSLASAMTPAQSAACPPGAVSYADWGYMHSYFQYQVIRSIKQQQYENTESRNDSAVMWQ